MKHIIGYLKNLNGRFFAKDREENLREVFFGDTIYSEEVIVNTYGEIIHDAIVLLVHKKIDIDKLDNSIDTIPYQKINKINNLHHYTRNNNPFRFCNHCYIF